MHPISAIIPDISNNTWFIATRGKAYNFHIPRINTNTFAYTAIKDWNSLPSRIKEIDSEKLFKKKVKRHLVEMSDKEEREDFKRD